jgi:hypothetical protein
MAKPPLGYSIKHNITQRWYRFTGTIIPLPQQEKKYSKTEYHIIRQSITIHIGIFSPTWGKI